MPSPSDPSPQYPFTQAFLGTLSEICIVTPNHLKTIQGLAKFSIGPFQIFTFNPSTIKNYTYRNAPVSEFNLTVAFAQHGSLAIEIIQPNSGPSLMADYLQEIGGKEGIQHVAFNMGGKKDGMEERVRVMGERGVKPAMRGTWMGAKGTCEFCFFDTKEIVGTVLETIEFSEDWEDPEGVWYPCTPEEAKSRTEEAGDGS